MSLLEMITPINAKVQLRYMLGLARRCTSIGREDFGVQLYGIYPDIRSCKQNSTLLQSQ